MFKKMLRRTYIKKAPAAGFGKNLSEMARKKGKKRGHEGTRARKNYKGTRARKKYKGTRARKNLQGHEGTRARKKYQGKYYFFEGTRFLSWGTRARKIYQGTRARGHVIFISGHEGT